MEPGMLFQLIVYSVVAGVIYFLIASGLSLVYGIMRVVNFAHGEFYMLGAFGTFYFFNQWGLNFFLAIVLSMACVALLGMVVERLLFRPLRAEHFPSVMVALGLTMVMPALAIITFGESDKGLKNPYPGVLHVLTATLSLQRLVILFVGLLFMGGLFLFIKYHRTGMAMRAVAQDPLASSLFGVKVDRTHSLAMGIGCALAGAAGALTAPLFFVNPSLGGGAIFTAFIVVVIGGMGSIPGALLGGLILGFIDTFGRIYLGVWSQVLSFAMVILVILIRPWGLMGSREN